MSTWHHVSSRSLYLQIRGVCKLGLTILRNLSHSGFPGSNAPSFPLLHNALQRPSSPQHARTRVRWRVVSNIIICPLSVHSNLLDKYRAIYTSLYDLVYPMTSLFRLRLLPSSNNDSRNIFHRACPAGLTPL